SRRTPAKDAGSLTGRLSNPRLFSRPLESVPEAAHRPDSLRVRGIAFHFLPQPQNVDVHRALRDGMIAAPYRVQQLLSTENHARPAHERIQHAKLGRGKTQLQPLQAHLTGSAIQFEIAVAD